MAQSIDIFSDVICPWCFIGKRRLERALAALGPAQNLQVHWRPFQLNPLMPKEGISRKQYRIAKFGSWEHSLELDAKVIAVGKEEGIEFNFERIERTPNTVEAHRLIWLAGEHGNQDAVVEHLFLAYFTEGKDIGCRQVLIDIAAEAGLDRNRAETALNSSEGLDAIAEAGAQARRNRVEGVPFFVINGKITLAGAQPPATILAALQQADS